MFASEKNVFIKAILLTCRIQFWNPGWHFSPETLGFLFNVEKVYENKLVPENFLQENFLWIRKRHFGQRSRTFLPLVGTIIFLEIGNPSWKHNYSRKSFSGFLSGQVGCIFDHTLKLFGNSEVILLKSEEIFKNINFFLYRKFFLRKFLCAYEMQIWGWCWKFPSEVHEKFAQILKKKNFPPRKIYCGNFLWTHKLYFNRTFRKKFAKDPNFFLPCLKGFIENLSLKTVKRLWNDCLNM